MSKSIPALEVDAGDALEQPLEDSQHGELDQLYPGLKELEGELAELEHAERAIDQLEVAEGRRVRCSCGDGSCMLCDDNGLVPVAPAPADLKAIREWLCAITIGPPSAQLLAVNLAADAQAVDGWAQVLLEVADRIQGAAFERRLVAATAGRCFERMALLLGPSLSLLTVTGPSRPATAADYERIAAEAE